MTISTNNDPSVNNQPNDFSAGVNTATTQNAKNTQTPEPTGLTPINDTLETADNQPLPDYQKSASKPGLPPPAANAGSVDEAVIAQLYDPHQFLEFLKTSDIVAKPTDGAPKDEDDDLSKVVVDDPEINQLASQLGISPGEAQRKLQATAALYFKNLIKDLPEEQQNQLTFAFLNPESAQGLSPELKTLLKNIQQTITKEIINDAQGVTIDPNWKGITPPNTSFNDSITAEFDSNFEGKLSDMELGEQITPQQALNLRTMHYMPGTFADDTALQALFKEVEGSVVADLQKKYGTGVEWTPVADSGYMTQVTNGYFRQNFTTQLNAYQPALTDAQKQEIMDLYANPNLTPSSADISKIAKDISTKAISATIAKFGLETTWAPVVTTINAPMMNSPQYKLAFDAFNTATQLYNKYSAMVNGLPEGPAKTAYLDFLKNIGETLNKIQEYMYSISSTDSATSKKLSKANMDTSLADIKRAQKQVDEAKAKEADTKQMDTGPLGDITNWLGQIVSLAVSLVMSVGAAGALMATMGPVFAIAVATVIATVAVFVFIDKAIAAANGTTPITEELFSSLNEAIGDPGAAGSVAMMLSAALSCGNPLLFLSLTSDSKAVQNVIQSAGGDTMAQELGAAIFNGAAQIIVIVGMMSMSGGAAAPALLAQITATISKVTTLSQKTINIILYAVNLTFTIALGAIQATQQGLQAKWEMVQAEITTILAQSDAATEEIQALLKVLKKLISKLLEAMKGNSEDIVEISKMQGKKWTDASAVTADLQG